jgi:periplasmic copper chaperone A
MRVILQALLCVLAITQAAAQDITVGAIKVGQPWVPAPPNSAQVAGGYLTLTNTGTVPDTLIGGSAAIAGRVEIHEMSHEGGVMRMRELKAGLVVKPKETITLRPGGLHLMLIDLAQQPTVGKPFKGTLVFAKAGTVEIEFKVEPFGTRVPGDGGRAAPAKSSPADPHKGHGSGGKH